MIRCWHDYLSGARCKCFTCAEADANAITSSLTLLKSRMVYFADASLSLLCRKTGHEMGTMCSSKTLLLICNYGQDARDLFCTMFSAINCGNNIKNEHQVSEINSIRSSSN